MTTAVEIMSGAQIVTPPTSLKLLAEAKVRVKQSHYRPLTGPESSRILRLPDFKTIGT
jgi:hypothetical protein